jgi:two-component system response regulator FlrC
MFFYEDFGRFQTGNEKMCEAIANARRWAPTLKPVMILGEPGTGRKEMALEVLEKSSRSRESVLRLTADLEIPSQISARTVVIENLESFSKAQQATLLRRVANSLGENAMESPRWIVTACRELLSWVRRGEILPSLYQVFSEQIIVMPSLQERHEDVENLILGYVTNLNEIFGTQKRISAASLMRLQTATFERNLIDLYEKIERAFTLAGGPLIDLKDFGFQDLQMSADWAQAGLSLSEMERRLIKQTLELTNQNRTRAAEILGISIRTLRNKLNEYRDQEGA